MKKEPFKKDDNHAKKIAEELVQPVVGLLFELKHSFSYIKENPRTFLKSVSKELFELKQ